MRSHSLQLPQQRDRTPQPNRDRIPKPTTQTKTRSTSTLAVCENPHRIVRTANSWQL